MNNKINLISKNKFDLDWNKNPIEIDNWNFIGTSFDTSNHNEPLLFDTKLESEVDELYLSNLVTNIREYVYSKIREIVIDSNKIYELPTYIIRNDKIDAYSFEFANYKCKSKIPNIHFVKYVPFGDFRYFINVWIDRGYSIGTKS